MNKIVLSGPLKQVRKDLDKLLDAEADPDASVDILVERSGAFEPDPEFEASIRRGIEDADAGRLIDHDKVMAWARSLLTDKPLPPPKPDRE